MNTRIRSTIAALAFAGIALSAPAAAVAGIAAAAPTAPQAVHCRTALHCLEGEYHHRIHRLEHGHLL